jgi:hypothetical protein
MNWFSVQANAAIIAGVVSLSITLIMVSVAIILTNRKVHHNFNLEFAAEGVAREMLMGSNLTAFLAVGQWKGPRGCNRTLADLVLSETGDFLRDRNVGLEVVFVKSNKDGHWYLGASPLRKSI